MHHVIYDHPGFLLTILHILLMANGKCVSIIHHPIVLLEIPCVLTAEGSKLPQKSQSRRANCVSFHANSLNGNSWKMPAINSIKKGCCINNSLGHIKQHILTPNYKAAWSVALRYKLWGSTYTYGVSFAWVNFSLITYCIYAVFSK